MNRGEVYWAELAPRSGSEQKGRRPVVVMSHDAFNHSPSWMSIMVVPLSTSSAQAVRSPTVVELPAGSGGLTRNSVAVCHQVTTLDRANLRRRAGALSTELILAIEDALKAALDLP